MTDRSGLVTGETALVSCMKIRVTGNSSRSALPGLAVPRDFGGFFTGLEFLQVVLALKIYPELRYRAENSGVRQTLRPGMRPVLIVPFRIGGHDGWQLVD